MKLITTKTFCCFFFFLLYSCSKSDDLGNNSNPSPPTNAYTIKFNGRDMQVFKNGNEYYMFDDVVLDQETFDSLKLLKDSTPVTASRSAFTTSLDNYWPNGVVYYSIGTGFTNAEIQNINIAINHFRSNTTLAFIQSSTALNRIGFEKVSGQNYGGASDWIGMKGGYQTIKLNTGSWNIGVVIHEIGHAIGLYHEQSRADRDNFITINWNNIGNDPNVQYQFKTYLQQGRQGRDFGTFDWSSIMLYGSDAYTGLTNPSMVRRDNGQTFSAQRNGLSQSDIDGINYMYPAVYIRREDELIIDERENGESSSVYQKSNIIIKFYSDRNYTIPINLPFMLAVKVVYDNSGSYNPPTTIIVQPGNSSSQIGESEYFTQSDFGTVRQNWWHDMILKGYTRPL